jgi:hypothetical protein
MEVISLRCKYALDKFLGVELLNQMPYVFVILIVFTSFPSTEISTNLFMSQVNIVISVYSYI